MSQHTLTNNQTACEPLLATDPAPLTIAKTAMMLREPERSAHNWMCAGHRSALSCDCRWYFLQCDMQDPFTMSRLPAARPLPLLLGRPTVEELL